VPVRDHGWNRRSALLRTVACRCCGHDWRRDGRLCLSVPIAAAETRADQEVCGNRKHCAHVISSAAGAANTKISPHFGANAPERHKTFQAWLIPVALRTRKTC
jgi:hypothetical protein